MKNLLRKSVAATVVISVMVSSSMAFADKSGLIKEEVAIQDWTYLSISKDVAKDGRCNGAWTAEGYLMMDFYQQGGKTHKIIVGKPGHLRIKVLDTTPAHETLSGTGGYLQTNLNAAIMPLITADLMNAKRGHVVSKLDGIRIRSGEKAYRYAVVAYESVLPKIRAEVRKARDAKKVYRCPLDKDLSQWNAWTDKTVQNLYRKLANVYRANSWDKWEKDGTNKKIFAYVAMMAVYESTLPEDGEKVRILRRW